MVRLEKQGNTFVMITGQKENIPQPVINDLIDALSELQKNPRDKNKLKEGLLFLDNSTNTDLRNEIRAILQKAMDYKEMTITDL